MANSYANRLTLLGPEDDLVELSGRLVDPDHPDTPIAFHMLLPEPSSVSDGDVRRWRELAWGAPYTPDVGALEHELRDLPPTTGERVYLFTTDGGTPVPVAAEIARLYPSLRVELVFHEPALQFAGFAVFDNGQPIEQWQRSDRREAMKMLGERWPDELEMWE